MRQIPTLAAALALGTAAFLPAECVVELRPDPITLDNLELEASPSAPLIKVSTDPFASPLAVKGIRAADAAWYVPHFRADLRAEGGDDSTFWSVRNDSAPGETVEVAYRYFSVDDDPLGVLERATLGEHEVASFDARSAAGLRVDADGFARGFVRITPSVEREISVDYFQVDASQSFASGALAAAFPRDFCTRWQVRFLDFGGESGSVVTFLVNGPQAPGSPTIFGNVYNQRGEFVNALRILSRGEWTFECDVRRDLVAEGTRFGSIDLRIAGQFDPGGVVAVTHNAFGRFSVGTEGICEDPAP